MEMQGQQPLRKKKQDSFFKHVQDSLQKYDLPEEIDVYVGEGFDGHPMLYSSMDMTQSFKRDRRMGVEIDLTNDWMRMPPVKYVRLFNVDCAEDAADDHRMSVALEAVIEQWSKDWSPCITPPVLLLTLFTDVSTQLESV